MGLTIHYKLNTRRRLDFTGIKRLLAPLRPRVMALGFEEVEDWLEVGPDCHFIYYWPRGAKKMADLLPPVEGCFFNAIPGDGSESVRLGLCRFPGVPGWQLEGHCKTQFASRHGWAHFLRCHDAVVQSLYAVQRLGIQVKVEDEGGLWETGSHAVLRRNLAEYDQCMAALGGALKDTDASGTHLTSPIFDHPEFERLEAKGQARHADRVAKTVRLVTQLVASEHDPSAP